MAKSKPRKKKGSLPCSESKEAYTKIAKRLNELCQMVDCNIILRLFDLSEDLVSRKDINKKDAQWESMALCLNKYYQHETLSYEELKEVKFEQMLSG